MDRSEQILRSSAQTDVAGTKSTASNLERTDRSTLRSSPALEDDGENNKHGEEDAGEDDGENTKHGDVDAGEDDGANNEDADEINGMSQT